MIQVKCIQKFRDKTNKIIGYRLQDTSGNVKDVMPESLKQAIETKKIYVVNLKLTSDNRLVDSDECEPNISFSYDEAVKYLEDALKKHVPGMGSSNTLYGELTRAINRIGYRFNNSEDMIGKGYGDTTCSPAARFISAKVKDNKIHRILSDMWCTSSEVEYERLLDSLIISMAEYLEVNKADLLSTESDDLFDY